MAATAFSAEREGKMVRSIMRMISSTCARELGILLPKDATQHA